jgi:hypothetical protein
VFAERGRVSRQAAQRERRTACHADREEELLHQACFPQERPAVRRPPNGAQNAAIAAAKPASSPAAGPADCASSGPSSGSGAGSSAVPHPQPELRLDLCSWVAIASSPFVVDERQWGSSARRARL